MTSLLRRRLPRRRGISQERASSRALACAELRTDDDCWRRLHRMIIRSRVDHARQRIFERSPENSLLESKCFHGYPWIDETDQGYNSCLTITRSSMALGSLRISM